MLLTFVGLLIFSVSSTKYLIKYIAKLSNVRVVLIYESSKLPTIFNSHYIFLFFIDKRPTSQRQSIGDIWPPGKSSHYFPCTTSSVAINAGGEAW